MAGLLCQLLVQEEYRPEPDRGYYVWQALAYALDQEHMPFQGQVVQRRGQHPRNREHPPGSPLLDNLRKRLHNLRGRHRNKADPAGHIQFSIEIFCYLLQGGLARLH